MRAANGLDALVSTLAVSLVAVALAITLAKVWPGFPRHGVRDVALGALIALVVRTLLACLRRLPKFTGALALDVHHGFSDRLTSALSFAGLPESERTPLMDAAIEDACQRTAHLSPRRAAPFFWPRDLGAALGLGAGVALLLLLQVQRAAPLAQVKTIQPVVLSADDIDLFREVGKKLAETDKTPEVLAALQAYNQLVEDLAQKRLDRTEAFRRMHEIESRLMEGRALDAKELEEQLKRRAAALKKSELSRPAAEALEKQDFAKAERALRELAKKLREKPDSLAKAQLERLRDAMKKAAEGQKERLAALEQRREELRQQLLMQKRDADGGGPNEEERSLFQKKERELERLERELEGEQRASRKLDRLDRDLQKAAEDLMRDLGLTADDLDQGAEDINRLAEEKMSDEEREELRQRLEDLREQLRQEGQGGAQRMARLRRFVRQARGEGQSGGRPQSCPPGDPNCKEDDQEQEGEGEGQQGQKGQGQGQGDEQVFTIGPGGQRVLVMSRGQRSSPTPGQGEGKGQNGPGQDPGGNGQDKGGKSAGHGHDPNLAGRPTNPKMGTLDVQAAGIDTGQGASRSEVILGAAERGFKGGAYKRVYTEYRTSAEEQMHKDQIPPGANDHVRRYFDLIRPRE
jgi:hypothetical protein